MYDSEDIGHETRQQELDVSPSFIFRSGNKKVDWHLNKQTKKTVDFTS